MFIHWAQCARLLAAGGGLADGILPWVLFLGGAVVVILVLKRFSKRSAILDDPRRKATAEDELRRSMDRLLIELQETSREINATLDTKMIVLNKLIEDADRRIETLRSLQRPGGAAPAPKAVERPQSAREEPETAEGRRRRELEREIGRLADEGKTDLEIARLTNTPRGEVELVLSLRRLPDGPKGGQVP